MPPKERAAPAASSGLRATLPGYPYLYEWDTTEEAAGDHLVQVAAVNGVGLTASSQSVVHITH